MSLQRLLAQAARRPVRGRPLSRARRDASASLKKGDLFRRRSDGYLFRVISASRVSPGAHLQCVDARKIAGWYTAAAIHQGFTHVAKGTRRDPGKGASSDAIWGLAERMLAGDGDAAIALSEIIGNGVTIGSTRFERITMSPITRYARKRQDPSEPAKVLPDAFAAITPGRSIILFGIKTSGSSRGVMRGYLRMFKVGDRANYQSWKRHGLIFPMYPGAITSITAKRVMVQHHPHMGVGSKKSSLDIETFNSKNWNLSS